MEREFDMTHKPELEIFSDFNCTWCYFDKPSIKKLEAAYDVQIIWRAFPLHPDVPDEGFLIEELFGSNIPLMTDKMQQLENMAASLGLPLAKRTRISNSRLSQELSKWAQEMGKLGQYQDAVYTAYFAHGLDISDTRVLQDVAEAAGLPGDEALKVIETGKYGPAVDKDWEASEELGIMVAPTYIMNDGKLTGSQSYESLEGLMKANQISIRRAE